MLWPPDPTPSFVSITGRPIAGHGSRIGISVQSLAAGTLDVMAEVSAAMESRLGTLDRGVVPPPREVEYDRAATRRLEREIQELLEGVAADPGSRSELSKAIFEREILFRHLTQLGG